jgi:hypothetical protein
MPLLLTFTEPCHQAKQKETLTMTTTVMALRCYQVSMYRKTTNNDGNQNKLPSDQQGVVKEPPAKRQMSSVSFSKKVDVRPFRKVATTDSVQRGETKYHQLQGSSQ